MKVNSVPCDTPIMYNATVPLFYIGISMDDSIFIF